MKAWPIVLVFLTGCAIDPAQGIAIYENDIRPQKQAQIGSVVRFGKKLEGTISVDVLEEEFKKDPQWAVTWWLYWGPKLPSFTAGYERAKPIIEQLNKPPTFNE